ncbi:hypothetical protein EV175_002517 [Coemansia sp. RSA 1933]|nr:hypothetical protein EV175_002517 [Coemansia sp. RSA 1933]
MSTNDLPLDSMDHDSCVSASRYSSEHASTNAVYQSTKTCGQPSGTVGTSSSMHDHLPQRLSLDSQRTAIGGSHDSSTAESRSNSMGSSLRNSVAESCMEHMGGEPEAAPSWSDEQLRRARRFSSSHIRGASCPTLNITRIMRSISVSNAHSSSRTPYRSTRHESLSPVSKTRFHSQQQPSTALVSLDPLAHSNPEGFVPESSTRREIEHRDSSPAAARALNQAVATAVHINPTHENNYSNGSDVGNNSSSSSSNSFCNDNVDTLLCPAGEFAYSSTTATNFSALSSANAPSCDGLRRRLTAQNRDIGTPEISTLKEEDEDEQVLEDVTLPLSPALLESTVSVVGESSATSSAIWSATSAELPHKRCSYSSAAIAEAVERHGDLNALFTPSHQPQSTFPPSEQRPNNEASGETMTITLKSTVKRESTDATQQGADGAQHSSESKNSCDSSTTEHSERVTIPAIYLDSTASLWDQYLAELQSSDFDSNIRLKRKRVSQVLRIPWNVEKLLWFGVAICIDALLYVFSILPAKFACAAANLCVSVAYDIPVLLESAFASSLVQTILRLMPISWSRRLTRLGLNAYNWLSRISGRNTGEHGDGSSTTASGHMGRWVSPMQLFDLYRGLLFIVTCVILCRIDAAQMYHGIRAQGSLKLYFIFSTLDIFDRLLSSFGHDALDALQSTVTDPWSQRWRTGPAYFVLAQAYMLVHTLVLFYQMITLHVAVNSYSDQLLALLISNRFGEIKSNVFKKWEKEMLFQISCADIVERFQETVFLLLIILRNLAELSGSGSSSLFDNPTSPSTAASAASGAAITNGLPPAQLPVSFDKATPSAFGPLIPSWMSMPVVNRIITPILMVLGSEILIDWIKHSFVTKLNWIRPEVYSHYIGILSRDLACPKSGSRVSIRPPPELNGAGQQGIPSASGSDADEKLARNSSDTRASSSIDTERKSSSRAQPRTRSSSILTHAALRILEWVRGDDEADDQQHIANHQNTANDDGNSKSGSRSRRRGHQRTHSVTKPQLFVEQSTRVSRRLGLSPMPLACLIILVLVQVVHILVWPPRTHHISTPSVLGNGIPLPSQLPPPTQQAGSSSESSVIQTGPTIGLWIAEQIAGVPILGTVGGYAARACGWTIERVILKGVSAATYAVVHPQKAMVSVLSVVFLDVVGWMVIGVVAYAVVVWIKLGFGSKLMDFAWSRYREFERQTSKTSDKASNLKQFDDSTRKLDRDAFAEVGNLINRDVSEVEWEKQRPKWTIDNIERFSLFKSRIQ